MRRSYDDVQKVQIVDFYPEPGTPEGDSYDRTYACIFVFWIALIIVGQLVYG